MPKRRGNRWTIDEFARRSGVSTRTIRYYQTFGLLPAPAIDGATGYYGPEHADRLTMIQELRSEGVNLRGIGWLLGGADDVGSAELRRLKGAVLEGWVTGEPEEVPTAEILRRLQLEEVDADVVRRAVELGLIERAAEPDRWRILMPSIMRAGVELRSMGISASESLDVLAVIITHVTSIAEAFVGLVDRSVVAPFDARGRPAEEWLQVRTAIERLRPLAGEAVLAALHHRMPEVIGRWLGETDSDV